MNFPRIKVWLPKDLSLLTALLTVLGAAGPVAATPPNADFNGDGFDDLAIGNSSEDIGAFDSAGAVNVLYGSRRGLRAKGDQLWHQDSPGIKGVAQAVDLFGALLTVGDFNNDGFDDLVITARRETIGASANAGAVHVLYGTAKGLTAKGDQLWHQDTPGIKGVAEADVFLGEALSVGDFDNDGFDDLAISASGASVGTVDNAGAVHVLYGSAKGLTAKGDQLLHQDTPGVKGVAEADDFFGFPLAAGDFDKDGFDDLAIGIIQQDVGTAVDAGAILILYGSAKGLTAKGDQIWHEDTPGIKGHAEANDNLAISLATGDFDKDGFHDLAIGASREGIGIIDQAGAVHVLYGSAGGLTAAGDQLWHQDKTGIKGAAGDFDRFGNSLTTGDFDNDGFHDLAVGIPFEDISTVNNAGAVEVLYGSRRGLRAKGDQLWHQDTPGIKDVAEDGDSFGSQVSVGDFDGDGFDDLVAAAGGELTTTIFRDGMVHVIHGSAKGLRPKGDQIWHQDTPGIKEVNDRDGFGAALP